MLVLKLIKSKFPGVAQFGSARLSGGQKAVGSNPTTRTDLGVAQLGAREFRVLQVAGSNPATQIVFMLIRHNQERSIYQTNYAMRAV